MKPRQTPYVEEIFDDSDELNTLKPEFRAIPPQKLISTIQERLNGILTTYEEKRAENPNQYANLFKSGYSHTQKKFAIQALKELLNKRLNVITEETMKILRDGNLGKALRAATHSLATRSGKKEIGSIHEMVAFLQYEFFKEGPIADKLAHEKEKTKAELNKKYGYL